MSAGEPSRSGRGGAFRIEIWEPTFLMEPKEGERFVPRKVQEIIKTIMGKKLKDACFDNNKCKTLSLELVTEVKEEVKKLNIPRYKLVCQSVIGEVNKQGCYTASRCLWDTNTDNYASFSMTNADMFATVMVFGLYLE